MSENDTPFKMHSCTVVDVAGKRFLEVEMYADGNRDTATQWIHARVEIDATGHPPLPAAHLEGLRILRTAIGQETSRLSRLSD